MHLEDILRISSLLPVVAYFFSKKRGVKLLQAIFFFNVFYVIFEVIYYSLRLFDKDLSNIFNLFFVPSEYLFIYYVFYNIFQRDNSIKILNISLVLLLLFWAFSSFFISTNTFNSSLNGFESILVIFLSLIYFNEEIKMPQTPFIYSQPNFWAVIGFFIFFAGSFFVFLYKQTYRHQDQFKEQYILIHSSLFILRSFLFSIAIFINPEKNILPNERSTLI